MDGGAWKAEVHGVARSRTWLSNFTFTFHFHALEKEMATHSSVLAWRIPGTGEPRGLASIGSHRVGHNWSDLVAAGCTHYFYFCFIDYTKALDCLDHNKLENSERNGNTKPPYLLPEKSVGRSRINIRNRHGITDRFQIGKEYVKAVYCHPAYLTSM